MRRFFSSFFAAGFLLLLGIAGCTAPRSIINSGKVTPQGQFKAGFNVGANAATSPISHLDDITEAAVDAILKKDSVYYDQQLDAAAKALVAYSLDPVGPTFDFYLRYGLVRRLDVGYKYASGAHVLDAQYQFMGSTGTLANPGQGRWYGSVGLQYGGQQLGLINRLFLGRLQPLLQFSASRRDVVVPLIFSRSFGVEEEMGHIAFGAVYNHTFIRYGFEPGRIFRKYAGEVVPLEAVEEKNNFPSYGIFLNAKIGYKYLYVLPAITMYYQNYGSYKMLSSDTYSYAGFTFIPSLGVQAHIGSRKNPR